LLLLSGADDKIVQILTLFKTFAGSLNLCKGLYINIIVLNDESK